jgi:hypothetical protein
VNKYTLTHVSYDSQVHYHFISEKSFTDLQYLTELVKLLDIEFNSKRGDRLTLSIFEEPKFVDLTGKL